MGGAGGRGWYNAVMRLAMPFALFTQAVLAQAAIGQAGLQGQIRGIAADAHDKVSVGCSLPGTSLNCDLDAYARPAMQSGVRTKE